MIKRGVFPRVYENGYASGSASNKGVSLGEGLTKNKLINYLENIDKIPRKQLIKDMRSIGLKYKEGSGDGKFCKFAHKSDDIQVEIHAPHLKGRHGAKYDHIHIRNKKGQSLDKNLKEVPFNSPEAHIKVKDLCELIMELRPE